MSGGSDGVLGGVLAGDFGDATFAAMTNLETENKKGDKNEVEEEEEEVFGIFTGKIVVFLFFMHHSIFLRYLTPANTLYHIFDTLGEYQFVSYDEKLEDYLDSLGLPGKEYGAIVRAAEVRVVIREPPTLASGKKRRESLSGSDKKWSVIHYDKGKLYRLN